MIFKKTPKGQAEVKNKVYGLSMIERRVLIFIDGKRTLDELQSLPRVTALDNVLDLLKTEDYITQVEELAALDANSEAPSPESPESSDGLPPFRELPLTFQPDKFNMAKNYMTNTLNHFKGFYGATRLVRDIDGCQTHEELRDLYSAWLENIDGTRAGKKQRDKLRKELLDVL